MNDNLKKLIRKYNAYIVVQRQVLSQIDTSRIPFEIEFINSISPQTALWYKKEIAGLNLKVFGPKGLGSKAWVDAHFGCIAGLTTGLKEKNGHIISMARCSGHLNPNRFELWTLMTAPKYRKTGVGTATLALVCELNKSKEWISLIEQIENIVNLLYLKFRTKTSPLILNAIGFYHSKMPSVNLEAKIPQNSFEQLFKERMEEKIDKPIFLDDIKNFKAIKKQPILVSEKSKKITELGEEIANGLRYEVIHWLDPQQAKKRFDFEKALLIIRKL